MKKIFLFLFLVTTFLSCNFLNDSDLKINELSGKNWRLVEINNVLTVNSDITIKFSENTINGYNSCNEYNGEYKIHENELSFNSIMSTKVGCIGNIFENQFMTVLNNTAHYLINNDELAFKDKNGNIISKFKLIQ